MAAVTTPGDQEAAALRAQRAASFGGAAAAYAEHRPDYAPAAIGWALAPVLGRDQVRVLDLGAGTGKLTAGVLATGRPGQVSVTAAEPDPDMLAELRRQLPGVTAVPGRAEEIPLPDASVDAVLCGQAAHWFVMDRALPEIARVLTGGGVFASLWNMDDTREPWVADLLRTFNPSMADREWTARQTGWLDGHAGRAEFGPVEQAEFGHGQLRTADSLVALLATHSQQLVMEPGERASYLARIRGYLAGRPETAHGEFRLPLLTGVLRSVRNKL